MNSVRTSASALVLLAAVACGGAESVLKPGNAIATSKGTPGGGGTQPPPPDTSPTTPAPAPSGGTQIPPSPAIDGPAWFFSEAGGIAGPFTANIDFDALQNQSRGGISVGTTRSAGEIVFNVSKKTALTITNISIVGANPGDFSVPTADIASALSTVLPPNKGAAEQLHVLFTPTAEGLRTATLQVTSAAGIAQVFLTGTGLPQRPIVGQIAPLNFLTQSAPANISIQNLGGETLAIGSISIGGAIPQDFQFFTANHGLSNCFAGMLLAPKSFCDLAVGIAPGALPPASATLIIVTNDPQTPTMTVPLSFSP